MLAKLSLIDGSLPRLALPDPLTFALAVLSPSAPPPNPAASDAVAGFAQPWVPWLIPDRPAADVRLVPVGAVLGSDTAAPAALQCYVFY